MLLRFNHRWVATLAATAVALSTASCAVPSRIDPGGMSFSEAPLVGKVVWNDLVTDDLVAARRFYGGLFGWTFEQTTGPAGNEYVIARSGSLPVAGMVSVAKASGGAELSRWLPYVSVLDVDAAVGRATSAGGRVAVGPRQVPLGRVAAIIDPQGAVIGLARSRIGDPDDATPAAASATPTMPRPRPVPAASCGPSCCPTIRPPRRASTTPSWATSPARSRAVAASTRCCPAAGSTARASCAIPPMAGRRPG